MFSWVNTLFPQAHPNHLRELKRIRFGVETDVRKMEMRSKIAELHAANDAARQRSRDNELLRKANYREFSQNMEEIRGWVNTILDHTALPYVYKSSHKKYPSLFHWSNQMQTTNLPVIYTLDFHSVICKLSIGRLFCFEENYQRRMLYQALCPQICYFSSQLSTRVRMKLLSFLPIFNVWYNDGLSYERMALGNADNSAVHENFDCEDDPSYRDFCEYVTDFGRETSSCFLTTNFTLFYNLRSLCPRSCGMCKYMLQMPSELAINLDAFLKTKVPMYDPTFSPWTVRVRVPLDTIPNYLVKEYGVQPIIENTCVLSDRFRPSYLVEGSECYCFSLWKFCPVSISLPECEEYGAKYQNMSVQKCEASFDEPLGGGIDDFTLLNKRNPSINSSQELLDLRPERFRPNDFAKLMRDAE